MSTTIYFIHNNRTAQLLLCRLSTVNVKMKMYKNADSKCTILAKPFEIEYNLSGSDENELQKRHLREGEIYAERKSGGKY